MGTDSLPSLSITEVGNKDGGKKKKKPQVNGGSNCQILYAQLFWLTVRLCLIRRAPPRISKNEARSFFFERASRIIYVAEFKRKREYHPVAGDL